VPAPWRWRSPKLRSGSYFPDWLLERRKRAVKAMVGVVATCYLLGLSTRRMEKLLEQLRITRLSKSQVSVMARELDEHVEQFRTRPLDQDPHAFVAAGALTMTAREDGRVVNTHVLIGTGVNVAPSAWAPRGPRARGLLGRGRRRLVAVLPRPGRARTDQAATSRLGHSLVAVDHQGPDAFLPLEHESTRGRFPDQFDGESRGDRVVVVVRLRRAGRDGLDGACAATGPLSGPSSSLPGPMPPRRRRQRSSRPIMESARVSEKLCRL
jgi:hypothetical protein